MVFPGEIIEIVGRPSSGRTSLFVASLAAVTRKSAVAALVDADDMFDPASAARAGVDLARLLWVRCGGRRRVALCAADLLVRCPGFALVGLDLGESPPRLPLPLAFRLRLAVRRTQTSLVIVASRRVTGAGASLAVQTVRRGLEWSAPGSVPTRLVRMGTAVQVLRCRGGLPDPMAADTTRWWAA